MRQFFQFILFLSFFLGAAQSVQAYHHHDRVYVEQPWFHPHHVEYYNGVYYPHYWAGNPYYYYTPQYYYYYDNPAPVPAAAINVNLAL